MVAFGQGLVACFFGVQNKLRARGVGGKVETADQVNEPVQAAFDDAAVVVPNILGYLQTGGGAGVGAVFLGGLVLAEQRNSDFGAAVADKAVVHIGTALFTRRLFDFDAGVIGNGGHRVAD